MSLSLSTPLVALANAEDLLRSLREAGLTEQAAAAIISNPTIAWATAHAAKRSLEEATTSMNADLRRELLSTPIIECIGLDKRITNVLRRIRVDTLGDLVLLTDRQFRAQRGVGRRYVDIIHELLARHGFAFIVDGTPEQKLNEAVRLYGEAEYIPAKHMSLWQWRLDKSSIQYLHETGSLGELATTTVADYHSWRQANCKNEHESTGRFQVKLIVSGLDHAGMSLRGN